MPYYKFSINQERFDKIKNFFWSNTKVIILKKEISKISKLFPDKNNLEKN